MIPANDNTPRKADSAASPLAIRLFKARRADDLRRLIAYGTVVTVPSWLSADGNLPEVGQKRRADRVTEIRPSPDELMRLVVADAIDVRTTTGPISPAELALAATARVRCDKRGLKSEWLCGDGKWRPATELERQPKGNRRKSEAERQEDNVRHLAIRGSGGLPAALTYAASHSAGAAYWRMRHASMCDAMGAANDNRRQEIDRMGIGSRVRFDQAWKNAGLPPASRLPQYVTGIARGAEFLAFAIHSNPTAMEPGVEGGHDLVERQLVETIDQPRIDAQLGQHGKVLDMSIRGLTARQIAAALGMGDTKAGERKAVALQDNALAALAAMDERLAA